LQRIGHAVRARYLIGSGSGELSIRAIKRLWRSRVFPIVFASRASNPTGSGEISELCDRVILTSTRLTPSSLPSQLVLSGWTQMRITDARRADYALTTRPGKLLKMHREPLQRNVPCLESLYPFMHGALYARDRGGHPANKTRRPASTYTLSSHHPSSHARVCARKRRNCSARRVAGPSAEVCDELLRQIYFSRLFALLNILSCSSLSLSA